MWCCKMVFISIQSNCLLFQPSLWTGGVRPFQENAVPGPRDGNFQCFCLAKQAQFRAGLSYLSLEDK